MTTPALITPSAPSAKLSTPAQVSRNCLAAGGVLLAAGCYLGAAIPGDRAWSLTLLLFSVVLFAIAGAFEFRHRAAPTADKLASGSTAKDHIAGTPSLMPRPSPPAAQGPVPAKPAVTALAVVAPTAGAAMPSPAAPAPAPHRADASLDVATLMNVPLSDLLLAALCKDPEGARRIFAQALLHTDPGVVPAPLPQTHAVPQPAGS
jgi:hypothetical protein